MGSPLFQTFSEALKRKALHDFENTALGELFDDAFEVVESAHRARRAPLKWALGQTPLGHLLRRAKALSKRGVVNELLAMGGETGSDISRIAAKYARAKKQTLGEVANEQIREMLKAAGPIGDVILARVGGGQRRTSKGRGRVQRELDVMTKALRAFGFETLHKPSDDNPPTPREIEAAKAVLEAAGYTVVPPSGKTKQPTVIVRDRSRAGRVAERQIGETTLQAVGGRMRIKRGGEQMTVDKDDPIIKGEMIPVESSNVHSIGYDLAEGNLIVRFLGHGPKGERVGLGPQYIYYEVPMAEFQSMRRAASKGKWVWDHLRIRGTVVGHQYDYSLDEGEAGYIPRKATLTTRGEEYMPRTGMLNRPGATSLPRELVRALTPAQYRKVQRGLIDIHDRRGQNDRSRDRTRGSRHR